MIYDRIVVLPGFELFNELCWNNSDDLLSAEGEDGKFYNLSWLYMF